ncbi:MAG: translesion DNA synthesis-associated protein ImuA [Gammaproteobacteria bacterium]
MSTLLQGVLSRPDVWQAGRLPASSTPREAEPTGHSALDGVLHHGGWPRAALSELLADQCGIGEMQLLAPALARCSAGRQRLFLVAPPHIPYAPALQALGLRLERLLVLRPAREADLLWSLEQVLRSGACAGLVGWLPAGQRASGYATLRRLQVAARGCQGPAFLFREASGAPAHSPAALRLRLLPAGAELELQILKQRGGNAGQCVRIPRPAELLMPRLHPALLPVPQPTAGPAEARPVDAAAAGLHPAPPERIVRILPH